VTDLRELAQDLLAHAHECPAVAAALMRRAARELQRFDGLVPVNQLQEQADAQS
jgi:hypothetical protein